MIGAWDLLSVVARATARLVPSRSLAEVTTSDHLIPDLPAVFDGYTVIALADFHHRHPWTDRQWLRHAVEIVNESEPDVIAFLGDYGSSFRRTRVLSQRWYREALSAMMPELRRLRATDGILAVLGNHDYYAGVSTVEEWLCEIGAEVLVNRSRHVTRAGYTLRFAGVDDLSEGALDPWVGSDINESSPTVLLSHNPDAIEKIDPRLRVDVMIAGHTHGGQIVLPWFGAPLTMSRICGRATAHGWIRNQRAALYVTRGLGEQLPIPLRLGCRPEIFVLRLRTLGQQPA